MWNKALCLVGQGNYRAKMLHSAFTMEDRVVSLGIFSFTLEGMEAPGPLRTSKHQRIALLLFRVLAVE